MTKIRGMDEATKNRLRYVETEWSYLEDEIYEKNKSNPKVKKADKTLKSEWIKRTDVQEAYAALVVLAHENEEPVAPESVMKESEEWTSNDNLMDNFSQLFEATGDEGDKLTPGRINEIAERKGIQASKTLIGRWLRRLGFRKEDERDRNGVKRRFWLGIKEFGDGDN